jgi:hypothetical protein|tara:strand:+ start:2483 stop:2713 length:231 start_codon:yes stop_codon:yes gene_type:complete
MKISQRQLNKLILEFLNTQKSPQATVDINAIFDDKVDDDERTVYQSAFANLDMIEIPQPDYAAAQKEILEKMKERM